MGLRAPRAGIHLLKTEVYMGGFGGYTAHQFSLVKKLTRYAGANSEGIESFTRSLRWIPVRMVQRFPVMVHKLADI